MTWVEYMGNWCPEGQHFDKNNNLLLVLFPERPCRSAVMKSLYFPISMRLARELYVWRHIGIRWKRKPQFSLNMFHKYLLGRYVVQIPIGRNGHLNVCTMFATVSFALLSILILCLDGRSGVELDRPRSLFRPINRPQGDNNCSSHFMLTSMTHPNKLIALMNAVLNVNKKIILKWMMNMCNISNSSTSFFIKKKIFEN